MIETDNKLIILGLGNPLFQDEGLGVHVIHQLMHEEMNNRIELIDGGTDGLGLLEIVERADYLIIVDAIDGNLTAGTVKKLDASQIPLIITKKLSPHQFSFQEVLALAHLRNKVPQKMILIGVQPKSLDWGTELTREVAAVVPVIINLIYKEIEKWLASDITESAINVGAASTISGSEP